MDRDIAIQITEKITAINTALQTLVTNTTPTPSDNRSVPAESQRSTPDPEEPEDPVEEPETRTKK